MDVHYSVIIVPKIVIKSKYIFTLLKNLWHEREVSQKCDKATAVGWMLGMGEEGGRVWDYPFLISSLKLGEKVLSFWMFGFNKVVCVYIYNFNTKLSVISIICHNQDAS